LLSMVSKLFCAEARGYIGVFVFHHDLFIKVINEKNILKHACKLEVI